MNYVSFLEFGFLNRRTTFGKSPTLILYKVFNFGFKFVQYQLTEKDTTKDDLNNSI